MDRMRRHAHIPFAMAELKHVLLSASAMVRRFFFNGSTTITRKQDGSPVTDADLETNALLRRELTRLLPAAGWLSEESADDTERLNNPWTWVVDPLDGTKEFARGIPEFAISVGLVYKHEPAAGGVVNPVTCEIGVWRQGQPIEFGGFGVMTPPPSRLAEATASISRSEIEDGTVTPYLPMVGTVRAVGSVAYKLLRVAAGVDDLTFSVQPKCEWDICGGVGLLQAAGKAYRRCDSLPVRFNQTEVRIKSPAVAGPAALVEEFIARYRGLMDAEPATALP
jgi:myo-inositol-1(or 4)-monophosphatase